MAVSSSKRLIFRKVFLGNSAERTFSLATRL